MARQNARPIRTTSGGVEARRRCRPAGLRARLGRLAVALRAGGRDGARVAMLRTVTVGGDLGTQTRRRVLAGLKADC
jgi:hypothetical protein